jgi:hypothetical protein
LARCLQDSGKRTRNGSAAPSAVSLDSLPESGSALVVGHSPTNEAAVLGLTGEIVAPLAKGAGVRVVANDDGWQVKPLD